MEQQFVHTSGSLLQAWQLLSYCSAVLILAVIAVGLMWRLRVEAKVLVHTHRDATPPVLQRLQAKSLDAFEPNDAAKLNSACLSSFLKPASPSTRRTANGD